MSAGRRSAVAFMGHRCNLHAHIGTARSIGLDARTRFLEPLRAGLVRGGWARTRMARRHPPCIPSPSASCGTTNAAVASSARSTSRKGGGRVERISMPLSPSHCRPRSWATGIMSSCWRQQLGLCPVAGGGWHGFFAAATAGPTLIFWTGGGGHRREPALRPVQENRSSHPERRHGLAPTRVGFWGRKFRWPMAR
jgi:hypothetical protein